MKKILFAIPLAFIIGTMVSSPHVSAGIFSGNSVDDQDRPSGFARYFTAGDIMNECLWEIVAPEACRMGILFDNQKNMNQKVNWLMEQHGYVFEDPVVQEKEPSKRK